MKKNLLALLIAVSLHAHAGNLTAQINTNTVVEGDSFQLVISTDGQGGEPDLSPLQKDFTILGRSQSSNVSIINGNMSKKLQWIVTLSPKHQGKLDIPAISAGGEQSKPLTINVVDASQAPKAQGASNGITLTTQIKNASDTLYVFQEIPLTVRIETAQPLLQAGIVEPILDGAELTQIGQDRQSQMTKNGRVVNVIERDYSLRVQQAGEMTIRPFTLKGEVPDGSRRHDPFAEFNDFFDGRRAPFGGFGMQRGKPFSVRGNSLTLNIEGKAGANADQWFLPAKAVELQAKWQPQSPTFSAGVPVTREISLLALGAQPEQLPTLDMPQIDGVQTYIDSDKTDKIQTADGTIARRVVTLSIVPEYGGDFTLPEVRVAWQNTGSGKAETATLPAEKITVSGAPAPVETKPTDIKTPLVTEKALHSEKTDNSRMWWWIGGSVVLAVSGLGFWFLRRKNPSCINREKKQRKSLEKTIKTAIQNQDAKALYQALLAWRQSEVETNQDFNKLMTNVESAVFHGSTLNFEQAQQTVNHALTTSTKTTKPVPSLPELYKT